MLDAHTVQLGAGDQAVRIIGPAHQILKHLQETLGATVRSEPQGAGVSIRVWARRQLAAVLIDGLPRPATLLAEQLTRLRLGMLLLRDERRVDREDVAAGYAAAAVGHSRAVAVRRSCLRLDPGAAVVVSSPQPTVTPHAPETPQPPATPQPPQVQPPQALQEPVDVHVIFAQRAIAPARLCAAADRSQLVLPVVRHRARWDIGPLLSRDHGPCPQCLLLHGTAADPHWEAMQTALAEQGPSVEPPLDPQDAHSAAVVASLLAREVQLAVDGEFAPQTASRVIGLCAATGRLSLEPVTPHPECACRLRTPTSG